MRSTIRAIVHTIGDPGPPRFFDTLHGALTFVSQGKITGYINLWEPGYDPEVIEVHKGKRRGINGKWILISV